MGEDKKSRPMPSFLSSPLYQEFHRSSFERHRTSPHVSLDAYLAEKKAELQSDLAGKQIIYLDTNHWINLRHVVLNSPLQKPAYGEMLELLTVLHRRRTICCPISFILFIELMKQSDPVTRLNTAKLMDRFSNGFCFQFPVEMARTELAHFLLGDMPNLNIGAKPFVWTKIGFLGGQLIPTMPNVPDETNNLIQKAWADLMLSIGLEQMLEYNLDSINSGSDFWEKYAAASNADASVVRSSNLAYTEVLQREKALLVRNLIENELSTVSQEIIDEFPDFRDLHKLRPVREYSPFNFPSLQILAGITASNMLSKMRFEANDLLDFRHASLAIPYCNAVCCDHPMATQLRNKPCEFDKVYGMKVFGRVVEINSFLKGLSR